MFKRKPSVTAVHIRSAATRKHSILTHVVLDFVDYDELCWQMDPEYAMHLFTISLDQNSIIAILFFSAV